MVKPRQPNNAYFNILPTFLTNHKTLWKQSRQAVLLLLVRFVEGQSFHRTSITKVQQNAGMFRRSETHNYENPVFTSLNTTII